MAKNKPNSGGGNKSSSSSKSKSSSTSTCKCDHPYECKCGLRPDRPSRGHRWDVATGTWGGKGHRQKGGSGQVASVSIGPRMTTGGGNVEVRPRVGSMDHDTSRSMTTREDDFATRSQKVYGSLGPRPFDMPDNDQHYDGLRSKEGWSIWTMRSGGERGNVNVPKMPFQRPCMDGNCHHAPR